MPSCVHSRRKPSGSPGVAGALCAVTLPYTSYSCVTEIQRAGKGGSAPGSSSSFSIRLSDPAET
jgi:hypothetical protein